MLKVRTPAGLTVSAVIRVTPVLKCKKVPMPPPKSVCLRVILGNDLLATASRSTGLHNVVNALDVHVNLQLLSKLVRYSYFTD